MQWSLLKEQNSTVSHRRADGLSRSNRPRLKKLCNWGIWNFSYSHHTYDLWCPDRPQTFDVKGSRLAKMIYVSVKKRKVSSYFLQVFFMFSDGKEHSIASNAPVDDEERRIPCWRQRSLGNFCNVTSSGLESEQKGHGGGDYSGSAPPQTLNCEVVFVLLIII